MSDHEGHPDHWVRDDGTEMWADLPLHFPMGVTADGCGPATGHDLHHYECWCGISDCARWNRETGDPA